MWALDFGWWPASCLDRFTPGKGLDSFLTVQEAGLAPGTVWTGAENLAPTGMRIPDRLSSSDSLCWLRCLSLSLACVCVCMRARTHTHTHTSMLFLEVQNLGSGTLSFNGGEGKGKAIPVEAWTGREGSRKLRLQISWHSTLEGGKVVSLTHRPLLPPGIFPGSHFCEMLSRPKGNSVAGRFMSMKNASDTIRNLTRNLPFCSVMPQPTAPLCVPL